MGWLALGIIVLVIYLAILYWQLALVIIAICVGIFILLDKSKKAKEHEEKQRGVRRDLRQCVTTSVAVFESLPEKIIIAEYALDKAEEEFADNAFAPFWDAVEHAVIHLALFDQSSKEILSNYDRYKQRRRELITTPPAFELNVNTLPDASSTAERLRSIVRKAQKNFHFATIYEQRKTNQILVKGFQNLGEALGEMSCRIESSMAALSQSFSDSISDLKISNQMNAQKIVTAVESVRDHVK
ncbi:MAG: hypothetical protein Q8J63_10330 [Candidatus Aquicultor sp.]|nr:hypothetical protein [Candidatus Aquicultor sp.]